MNKILPIRIETQNTDRQETLRQNEMQNTVKQNNHTKVNVGRQNKYRITKENHDWKDYTLSGTKIANTLR